MKLKRYSMKYALVNIRNEIGQFLEKSISFLRSKQRVINKIYFISIIVYFFLVFLPNLTTSTPLSPIFNEGITKILYRVIIALAFGAISLMAFCANKIDVNRILLFSLLGFLLFLIFGTLFNLKSISTYYYNNYYEKVVITASTGIVDVLSYYGNLAFSYVFCFALFTCIPVVMLEKNRFLYLLDFFAILMLVLCFVSYIKDFKLYIAALKFDYNQYGSKDISSLFASKNAFGVFLFQGIVASLIAHHFRQTSKYRFVYIIASIIMSITIVFTMCKDAIFALALFIIVLFCYFFKKANKKKRDIAFIIIWAIIVFVSLTLFIILLNQDNLIDNSFFKKLFYFLGANPVNGNDNALLGRLEIVIVFFMGISGYHYLVGYAHSLPSNAYIWTLTYRGAGNDNLHNTFLHMFGTGGILYFLFYISLLCYVYRLVFKEKNIDRKVFFLLLGLLISHTFYSLFETSILFLSGSSATMLLSIILMTLLKTVIDNAEAKTSNAYCEVSI